MNITKYGHACFTASQDEQILVVDPGSYSPDFIAPEHVVGVVITHAHGDHYDHDQLAAIIDKNPEAIIVGPETVTSTIEVFQTRTVKPSDRITIGPFTLEFFGGEHAIIHSTIEPAVNVAVLINDLLYYPGDAFTLPFRPVDTLALPISAPWSKLSETIDFLGFVHPRLAFPTHDALLSDVGLEMTDRMLTKVATSIDSQYQRITEPLEI